MDTGGIGTSAGASARRGTATKERSSTRILVAVRDCVHTPAQDVTVGSPLTTTLVDASAAAPVETMRFLTQGTVCAGESQLPTHRPPGTPTHQPPGTPTHHPLGTPTHQPPGTPTHQPPGTPTHQPTGTPTHHPLGTPTHRPPGTPLLQVRLLHPTPMCANSGAHIIHAFILVNTLECLAGKQHNIGCSLLCIINHKVHFGSSALEKHPYYRSANIFEQLHDGPFTSDKRSYIHRLYSHQLRVIICDRTILQYYGEEISC